MNKITKAVIPIGGFGTRFLPITKSIPKEMLPILDKPVIQYIVEELASAGIEEIYMIVSKSKKDIINYFSRNKKLEKRLLDNNKNIEYNSIIDTKSNVKIKFIMEKKQMGSAKAISLAKKYIKNEDFVIVLGDDLIYTKDNNTAIKQLIDCYYSTGNPIIGVHKVKNKDIPKYGIIKPGVDNNIETIVEKPKIKHAPSNFAALGRYVVSHEIFNYIKKIGKGVNGEYQLTDVLKLMMQDMDFNYKIIDGEYHDIGNKEGHIEAIICYAIRNNIFDVNELKTKLENVYNFQ